MKKTNPAKSKTSQEVHNDTFVFTRKNYLIMIVSVLIVLLGYILMIGGGAEDPTAFSDEIFNFRRITLSPVLILFGFGLGVFAIFYTSKE
jgi:NADH:ubiquinone oxidoreductase subunit K